MITSGAFLFVAGGFGGSRLTVDVASTVMASVLLG